ncbi:type III secretion system export apparatus subunit SctU [Vitiosangium sp. GDMCC 1.1324]|uniref:type III secretion system export apparatus subunit SctU n=1 Tax=Vitiosangium sp. (strain GDMCC 1.1324) TaxID=2138576 RepID=UPI000D334E8F|nr:type III secretion system export apparatus subunit SctU [Vitiosangium sp. GDMCC 1.1324]PTL80503.1 EscU/YscU/HrcU family type III secretion system export apparatus switch protein [Vitiosangium sp. GDMCC 1.1324]
MSDEKTEEPTQKKLDDSRKKGQVWKSKDLTAVFGFVVGLGVVKSTWSNVEEQVTELFRYSFDHIAHPDDLQKATFQLMLMGLNTVLMLTVPIVGAVAVVGGLLEFLQVGSLFTMDPLMPKLEKLNPLEGFKNLFSKKQIVELLKNLIKISIAAYVTYGVVRDAMPLVVETVRRDVPTILAVMGELVYRVAVRVGMVFFLFAIFDVWWQRKSYMKDMMMSKDDVKKEYKESEGDPHQKAKRKEMAHEILEGAQMEAVKDADVIVTNPDHVAVALKYDKDKDAAPRVLVKGLDFKAERIKALAREVDVPTLRNVPLAHALLRVEVGEPIPEELYDAVAEVLNFVYGLKNNTPAARA